MFAWRPWKRPITLEGYGAMSVATLVIDLERIIRAQRRRIDSKDAEIAALKGRIAQIERRKT